MESRIDITRAKAIRLFCIDCSGGSLKEVRLCPKIKCHLYPFRMGRGYRPIPGESLQEHTGQEDIKGVHEG